MLHDNVSLFSRFLPKVSQKFLGVGNSSLIVQNCLFDHHSGSSKVFAENITLTVRRDIERKRTVALPSDLKLTLSDIHRKPSDIWPSKSVFPKALQDKPLYTMSICVPYSDTDSFNHLTHAMYGRYYTDCATNAIKAGLYRHFRDDICWYPVLELDIDYTGDVSAGETIEVRTWQGETPQKLYFETQRKGGVINSATFVYGLEQSKKNRISKLWSQKLYFYTIHVLCKKKILFCFMMTYMIIWLPPLIIWRPPLNIIWQPPLNYSFFYERLIF